jgi:rSAM-associated Gly-rich repeat protein
MADDRRSFRALAKLLPTGVLGLSIGLAAAGAQATSATGPGSNGSVAARLKAIRSTVSDVVQDAAQQQDAEDPMQLAWWGNGWHNGGWHNWGNGWHNGWGNGGWHNWGNGWHNGWHNW